MFKDKDKDFIEILDEYLDYITRVKYYNAENNIPWFGKIKNSSFSPLNDMLIPLCKENEIVVKKRMFRFGKVDRDDFIELLNTNKNLYEVLLTDRKRRLYFDLDNIEKFESIRIYAEKRKSLTPYGHVSMRPMASCFTRNAGGGGWV